MRIDSLWAVSPFNFVGALHIQSGGRTLYGTASALSPHWVLTAGHNLDTDDNGVVDAGIEMSLALPGYGSFTASGFSLNPGFTGFGTSSIGSDLGLLYLDTPLPSNLSFPSLYSGLAEGDTVSLVGFGRSGYGNYGYTTEAGTTDRRVGMNVVDSFSVAGGGSGPNVFHYDFDAPDTLGQPGGSLGNNVETIIGPGDSGGPILFALADGFGIAGVSTFTEGYGGRFGDIGGGVLIGPHLDWINSTLAIPEPSSLVLMLSGAVALLCAARRARDRSMA